MLAVTAGSSSMKFTVCSPTAPRLTPGGRSDTMASLTPSPPFDEECLGILEC